MCTIFITVLIVVCQILCLLDCEPEEVDDWSPAASNFHCSFCSLPLEKLSVSLSQHSLQTWALCILC